MVRICEACEDTDEEDGAFTRKPDQARVQYYRIDDIPEQMRSRENKKPWEPCNCIEQLSKEAHLCWLLQWCTLAYFDFETDSLEIVQMEQLESDYPMFIDYSCFFSDDYESAPYAL